MNQQKILDVISTFNLRPDTFDYSSVNANSKDKKILDILYSIYSTNKVFFNTVHD